jgi:hypothetical protein
MRKMARRRPPKEFEILDVTDEVIRDYNGVETEEEGLYDNGSRTLTGNSGMDLLQMRESVC